MHLLLQLRLRKRGDGFPERVASLGCSVLLDILEELRKGARGDDRRTRANPERRSSPVNTIRNDSNLFLFAEPSRATLRYVWLTISPRSAPQYAPSLLVFMGRLEATSLATSSGSGTSMTIVSEPAVPAVAAEGTDVAI